MKIQPDILDGGDTPAIHGRQLPSEIVERAAAGLSWTCHIGGATSLALTVIEYGLQPEFARAWDHPILRLASACMLVLSAGLLALEKSGWLSKHQLVDLGVIFQVAVSFAGGLFEGAAYRDPDAVVVGLSTVGVWMMVCGRLMPKPPVKSAITNLLCIAMWPLGYAADLWIFGYQPMPATRMLVWILPLVIVGVWTYVINNRTVAGYLREQRAEDIGSYSLCNLIGKGGMGEVWRATHRTLARDAALKLIRAEILHAKTGREEYQLKRRFEREARITASLRSPHTVALYDFGQTRCGAFYYAMELIDGVDLQTLVDQYGPMPPERVTHVLCQVAQSLEEAHRLGLVHRDIKPRNILVGKLGLQYDFVKVLDFGLVKSLHATVPTITSTSVDGALVGTPAYFAPETLRSNRVVDHRADLYSLGCTAYFLLTGKLVFSATTPTGYAIAHLRSTPEPVGQRCETHVPAGLESIVMRLIEKDPVLRIQTAHELETSLRALRDVGDWSPAQAERWWRSHLPRVESTTPTDRHGDWTPTTVTESIYAG